MSEVLNQYELLLYIIFIGIMQATSVMIAGYKHIRPRNGRKWSYAILLALFAANDICWSLFSYDVDKNELILAAEIVIMCLAVYFVMRYLFIGDALYNFFHIFALELIFQFLILVLTFPACMIICQFDVSRVSEFLNTPSLLNTFFIFVLYLIGACGEKVVWDFVYKHRHKHFKILLIVFCILDIGAPALAGWRIIVAGFLVGIYLVVFSIVQNNRSEKLLREQFAFYQDLAQKQSKREKEISVIRHDIANHMNVMEEMQKDEGGQKLLKKLDKANRSMTGIPVLDCLIREKASECEKEEITFTREGSSIGETAITEYEFVSLFANLLDNAIEAAKETEEKEVTLSMERQQGYLKITVSNSKRPERKPVEEGFKTSKKDKKNHGIGSRIIRDIVEKHDGRITYHDEGGKMRVVALVPVLG